MRPQMFLLPQNKPGNPGRAVHSVKAIKYTWRNIVSRMWYVIGIDTKIEVIVVSFPGRW